MKEFNFVTSYASYANCKAEANRYASNGNPALRIFNEEGCICTASVNPECELPDGTIAIKNWSENEGVDVALIKAGIIGRKIGYIPSGFVEIPVYELTKEGNELFENV